MGQKPFHISSLTMVLFGLSTLLDSGKGDDITIEDVRYHAAKGDLIPFLYKHENFDSGFLQSETEFTAWYLEKIRDLCISTEGQERRKYAIEHRGVCLLISYTAELIQQGKDIRMEHTGA